MVTLTCCHCGRAFQRKAARHRWSLRHRPKARIFCSPGCLNATKETSQTVPCRHCGTPVRKRASVLARNRGKAYCNRSCANAQANRDNPKRKARGTKGGTCQDCGGVCTLGCARCASCQGKRRHAQAQNRAGKRTKGEIFRTYRSWQSARSYFTKRAREVFLEANPGARCQVCGYAKHVDVCHIRGVSDFPAEATVGEINSPDNLVGLCPTHHWELDHDSLDMPLGGRGGT